MPKQTNSDTTAEGFAPPDNNNGESNQFARSEPSTPSPDPLAAFDPAKLRIDQSFLNRGAAKKLLTTVPIRRPNKQEFFRVHPGAAYRLTSAFIELKDDREVYLISPEFAHELGENEFFVATLYLCINRQKVLSFWPVKLPGPDGRQMSWHTSAQEAAEKAMEGWIRMAANMNMGAYEMFEAEGSIPDPEWPNLALDELLSIGFKNRIVSDHNHPVIQKLRGLL
jgi:hypothetical protein